MSGIALIFIRYQPASNPGETMQTATIFVHIKVVMGIIVGLSLTHLLRGSARLIQHPGRERTYWVHLLWVACIFLYLLDFWWWEFRLAEVTDWTLFLYLYLVLYALLLYLLCALLFPDDVRDYAGFKDYFYSRRRWIFGTLAIVLLIDIGDTLLKGKAYYAGLGIEYTLSILVYILACVIAMITASERYHRSFAVIALAYQIIHMLRLYFRLN
jgi:hypothetical protein